MNDRLTDDGGWTEAEKESPRVEKRASRSHLTALQREEMGLVAKRKRLRKDSMGILTDKQRRDANEVHACTHPARRRKRS